MSIALVVKSVDRTRRKLRVKFTPAFTGNYVSTGDTLDFTKATDPSFLGYRIPRTAPETLSAEGNPGGYGLQAVIGATNANSKLKAYGAGSGAAAPVELSAAGYPANFVADQAAIEIVAEWGRGSN